VKGWGLMGQVQVLEPQGKFVLPSGKELTLLDVLSFCYGLSETDVQILMALLRSSPKSTEDLEQELQLSKARVNVSLNKLLSLELVKRIKEAGNKAGRPRHIYFVPNFDELKGKVVKEIEDCTNSIRNLVVTQLTPSILA
jgi:Predicted transcriptional regulator